MLDSTTTMDDHELAQMKQTRRERVARSKSRGRGKSGTFFGSPWATVICMSVALGSVIGYWRGVPQWALLAMGLGVALILFVAGYAWRVGTR